MASKNVLNVSNTDFVEESTLANEDIALPVEDPDLPIVESSSPNGYFASTNVESVLSNGSFELANGHSATTIDGHSVTNGGSIQSNGHSATTNGVHSLTNGGSVVSNGHSATTNGIHIPTNGESVQSNGDSVQTNGHSATTNDEPILLNEEDYITRPEHVHDRAVQLLLQNWPVSENVKQRFEEEKIDYSQLASLNEEDLEMLGVEDEQTQSEMVVVFSQLANQNDKKYKAEYSLLERQNYSLALIDSMLVHLRDMNDVLAATTLQIELCPPDDVIIERKYHASEIVLKIIAKMIQTTKKFSHVVRDVEFPEPVFITEEEPEKEPEVVEPEVIVPEIVEPVVEVVKNIKRVPRVHPVFYYQPRPIIKPLVKSLILSIGVYFLLRRVLRGKL